MTISFLLSNEIIVHVKDGLIVKRLNDFETNISETTSLELTV